MEKNLNPPFLDTDFSERHIYYLLKVIKNNSSIRQLIREGLSFSKIGKLISKSLDLEYIINSDNKISLSELGLTKLEELHIKYKKINKNEWITEDVKNKIPRIDKNFIFLPRQDELDF